MEACSVRSWRRAPSSPPATGSLASSEASITPAWQAATTSSPGWAAARPSRVPATRLTKPVQLSPPGAIGWSGSSSQSRVPNRSVNSLQVSPSASPGWSSHRPHSVTSGGPTHPAVRPRAPVRALGPVTSRAGASSSAVSMARGSTLAYRASAPASSPVSSRRSRSPSTCRRPRSVRPGSRAARHTRPTRCTPPPRGGPGPAGWPTGAVPTSCGCRRVGRDRAHRVAGPRQSVEPPGSAGHASSPTNCSSWRRVRHSTTSSQWTAYSPTIESPESQ